MAAAKSAGPFLKVYLYRGFIGLPKIVQSHAKCLGLRQRYQTVYITPNPKAIGNLLKIKELVKVELVETRPPPREGPMYPKGYKVMHSLLPHHTHHTHQNHPNTQTHSAHGPESQ